MAFLTIGTKKVYGPLSTDDEFTVERLTRGQITYIYQNFNGVIALMVSDNRCGLWQSQRARDNVACFLSRGGLLPRPIDISRLLAQVRSLDEVLPV